MTRSTLRLFLAGAFCTAAGASSAGRIQDSGIFVIWYGKRTHLLEMPYITGGQAVAQWRDVEPEQGIYDFSKLDKPLGLLHERKLKATIQINGNLKPEWLFETVPCHPEKLSVQVRDEKGTLMFWHPVHEKAYRDLLAAFGNYLKGSPFRNSVIGVRMNFNAIGTEHHYIRDPADRKAAQWVVPTGVDPGRDWSTRISEDYQDMVFETYLKEIAPHTRVFVRNGLKDRPFQRYKPDFQTGKLSWFHTSSEPEPRGHSEWRFKRFYDFCRQGHTTAYAEPWASAWGDHGAKTDDRECSPPQWNYWRLLLDLNNGVSFVAVYANDLEVAITGKYSYWKKEHSHDDDKAGTDYKSEFDRAFRFAAKYAGYHSSPGDSPGAWCAFRGNQIVREANGQPEKRRKLEFYTGDYNFLMKRLHDNSRPLGTTGPEDQRFGGWARELPPNETMTLTLDSQFAGSLKGKECRVRTVYLDSQKQNSFTVRCSGQTQKIILSESGRWKIAALAIRDFTPDKIEIVAGNRPLILHMVEIQRVRD